MQIVGVGAYEAPSANTASQIRLSAFRIPLYLELILGRYSNGITNNTLVSRLLGLSPILLYYCRKQGAGKLPMLVIFSHQLPPKVTYFPGWPNLDGKCSWTILSPSKLPIVTQDDAAFELIARRQPVCMAYSSSNSPVHVTELNICRSHAVLPGGDRCVFEISTNSKQFSMKVIATSCILSRG